MNRALAPNLRALVDNSELIKAARRISEENSMVTLARQMRDQSSAIRTARLIAEHSSLQRTAEQLRGMADNSSFAKMARQMGGLGSSSAFDAMFRRNEALGKAISARATDAMVRDLKLNLSPLRYTEESALFRNARLLGDSISRGAAAYTFHVGEAALAAVSANAFVSLRSLHAFSGLTASSERLTREFDYLNPRSLATLAPALSRAPIIEPYLSARALAWFEPSVSDVINAPDVDDSQLMAEMTGEVEVALRARGWHDLADKLLGALERVQDDPNAPARVFLFASAARVVMKGAIRRLAPKDAVELWKVEAKRSGTYVAPPAQVKKYRNSRHLADSVRFLLRDANSVSVGYADFGEFDLVDCLCVLHRLEAVAHDDADLLVEGIDVVLHRVIGFVAFLLGTGESKGPRS